MMRTDDQAIAKIETYLKNVAAQLEGMPESRCRDLLRQLESHIHEALEARVGDRDAQVPDVEAVLADMDPPEAFRRGRRRRYWGLSLGQWALACSLSGPVLLVLLLLVHRGQSHDATPILVFWSTQAAALILGILSWRERHGKAAVFTSIALALISVLLCP